MNVDITETVKQSIGDFVRNAFLLFGAEVNSRRQLPSVKDGLKPSYRRLIYETLRSSNPTQLRKTADIIGSCMSSTHGHGDRSLVGPVANLVRWGIFKGQGNHGKKMMIGDDTDPSAMRYTEAALSEKFHKIFSELMPYVPYVDADVKGQEPEYLPTPIPLCLMFSTLGVGIGVNCRIPAFTIPSMMNALMSDDPSLLEAPFGLEIVKSESELDKLWTTGIGKICYKYKVTTGYCEGTFGVYLSGQPEIFKPLLSEIDKLVNLSRAYILDLTSGKETKVFIAREHNVKAVSNDDIIELVEKASKNTRSYRLTVSDGKIAYRISLRDWLRKCYSEYLELIEKFKSDKSSKYEFDREVYKWLPSVVEVLYNDRDLTSIQIAEKLGIDQKVVESILSKSISALRRKDTTEKVKSIEDKISYFKSIDPVKRVNEILNEFQA